MEAILWVLAGIVLFIWFAMASEEGFGIALFLAGIVALIFL